ncbi:M23 family metallopeptidase [Candidatus Sororendozoicomonas aggregata]|uniref:M23 family metallopeptidase n=1 Tax=Candidatus Sororendozoicomonas aggregata TaxID=3073239 RepID=UPI002ED3E648
MKITIIKNDHSPARSFQLGGLPLILLIGSLVVTIAAIGGAGMTLWLSAGDDPLLTEEEVMSWKAELTHHKQGLFSVRQEMERQLDSLSLRLAQLQGQMMRLDALGERLVAQAGLNDGEFDFSEPPASGGPAELVDMAGMFAKPALLDAIDALSAQIDSRAQQLELLESLLTNRAHFKEAFVAGKPVEKGWLSSRFGRRTDPFTGKPAWHNGVDFAGKRGTPILAMAAGVVTVASDRAGYGMLVEVNHGNGYVTRYAHNASVNVKVGEVVKRGQTIAAMGSSGRSTGNHVHIEVLRHGKQVDPSTYIYRSYE